MRATFRNLALATVATVVLGMAQSASAATILSFSQEGTTNTRLWCERRSWKHDDYWH